VKITGLDQVGTEETPQTLIPPGDYLVGITASEEKTSKNGYPQVALDLEILEGELKGRGVKDWLTVTEKALWRVKQVLASIGYPGVDSGDFDLQASKMIGGKATITIKHELWDGKVRLRIDHWSPAPAVTSNASGIDASLTTESDLPF
jgi:hypothetical protein